MKTCLKENNDLHDVIAAPYAAAVDTGMLIGAIFGIATAAITNGGKGVIRTRGMFNTSNLLASEAWTEGQDLYWDNTNKRLTTTSSGNTKCGYAAEPKAANATSGIAFITGKTG